MTKLWNKTGRTPSLIFFQKSEKNSFTAMNLHKPPLLIIINQGKGEQGRYTETQPKRILQNACQKTSCNAGTGCTCAYFPGKSPSWGFPTPKFLSIDLRVSGVSRTMVYRIRSSSVVPVTFPGHSLVSIHGGSPLSPLTSSENPFSLKW